MLPRLRDSVEQLTVTAAPVVLDISELAKEAGSFFTPFTTTLLEISSIASRCHSTRSSSSYVSSRNQPHLRQPPDSFSPPLLKRRNHEHRTRSPTVASGPLVCDLSPPTATSAQATWKKCKIFLNQG